MSSLSLSSFPLSSGNIPHCLNSILSLDSHTTTKGTDTSLTSGSSSENQSKSKLARHTRALRSRQTRLWSLPTRTNISSTLPYFRPHRVNLRQVKLAARIREERPNPFTNLLTYYLDAEKYNPFIFYYPFEADY